MKGIVRAMLCGLASLVVATAPAFAASYLDETVKALTSSPVYVVPGSDGSNSDTADQLRGRLFKGDRIVVVMWPSNSGSIDDVIRQLDDATEHRYIIGMSIGSEVRATASFFPAGTAAELMKRARTTSTSTPETLGTFVQNVHNWQRQHPEATPPEPEPSDSDGETSSGTSVIIMLGGCVLVFALFVTTAVKLARRRGGDIKLQSPNEMRDELRELLDLRSKVNDPSLRDRITQIGNDTEAYFRRSHQSSTKQQRIEDAQLFEKDLKNACDVVRRYIDVQDNPRYFDDPNKLLEKGAEAIEGFATFVLASIKRNNRRELTEFRVNTDILSAKRYS